MPLFPELTDLIKGFASGFSDADAFEKKGYADVAFNLVSAGELYRRDGFDRIAALLSGGEPAWTGETISRRTAMNLSVMWACNNMVSQGTAFLPIAVMQRLPGSNQLVARPEHPMQQVLNHGNDKYSAMDLRSVATSHAALEGNAYFQIYRRSGTNVAFDLDPIFPDTIRPSINKRNNLQYEIAQHNEPNRIVEVVPGKPHSLMHLRGMGENPAIGASVLSYARQTIGLALSQERNIGTFYAQGGRLPYVLTMPKKFASNDDFQKFRSDWEAVYRQPHRAAILENDMKYQQIGTTVEDMQLIAARQWSVPEMCRWWMVPPSIIGDMSKANYNSIYQLAKQFALFCLSFWTARWEQTFWRCVFTPEEKAAGYFIRHNLNHLMRGDFPERWAGYTQMLTNGVSTINEVREMEGWERSNDSACDLHRVQAQNIPLSQVFDTEDPRAVATEGDQTEV
jgi:HK97 family phage portal protein